MRPGRGAKLARVRATWGSVSVVRTLALALCIACVAVPARAQTAHDLGSPWTEGLEVAPPTPDDAPATDAPPGETPIAEAPPSEMPIAEAPPSETRVAEAPVTDPPAAEAPAVVAPAADAPVSADAVAIPLPDVAPPPSPSEPSRPRVRVFAGGHRRLSLYDGWGAEAQQLCVAPCELALEPGTYTLGVGVDDDPVRRPDHDQLVVEADTWIELVYSNRHAHRVGAAIMLGVGLPTGVAMIVSGIFFLGLALLVPGAVLTVLALAYGLGGAFANDHVDVRERPVVAF